MFSHQAFYTCHVIEYQQEQPVSWISVNGHILLHSSELMSDELAQRARGKQVTSEVEGTLKCKGENRDPYCIYYSGWSVHPNTARMCICMCEPSTTICWKPTKTLYCHIS